MWAKLKALAAAAAMGLIATTAAVAQDDPMQQALAALEEALPGTLMHNPFDIVWDSVGDRMSKKIVDAPIPGGKAFEVRNRKRKENNWDSNIRASLDRGIEKGETIKIFAWLRTVKPAAGKDTANIEVILQRTVEPYDQVILETVYPTEEWALYEYTGTANADFPVDKIAYGFNFGQAKQTVQIGQVYVVTLGVAE